MTFLPIVDRELRLAARKKGTYWTRAGVGLAAMVLGGIVGLVAMLNPTVRFGPLFFQSLSWLAMVYCLMAGRFLTADCLSWEKREETMGLLFLTDLKGYDVVLGKMAATSLNGLYGLLALLPVLALTLVTGGISNGEFCRAAVALLDAFFFSLAVGIIASALTREFRSAMALNFYLVLALAGLLPALAGILWLFSPHHTLAEGFFLPCPVYTLWLAFDVHYKNEPLQFWSSATFVLSMSWLLVALACRIAPQSWQVKPAVRKQRAPQKAQTFRSRAARAFRNQMLDQNAYYWMAARPWWKPRAVWAMIGVALFWLLSLVFSVGWLDESICIAVAFLLNGAMKFWITLEAGQSLAEEKRCGAFELLLSTPLAARDIVRGQFLALRRQFLRPLAVLAGIELFFMCTQLAAPQHKRTLSIGVTFCFWMAGILMLAADAVTLSVVAMEAALTKKNLTRALLRTVQLVLAVPWVLWAGMYAILGFLHFLFPDAGALGPGTAVGVWFVIGMAVDGFLAGRAWRRLTGRFREMALRQFDPLPARAGVRARCMAMVRAIKDQVWRNPVRRKWAVSLAALVAIGGVWELREVNRSHDPPPEIAMVGPGHGAKLQAVVAGEGVFLILPDGSLWRWGLPDGINRAVLPERVGTNRNWKTISVNGNQRLGVQQDGTLWEWQRDGVPMQVGAENDWVEAVGGEYYKVARKKGGTLWAWGDLAFSSGHSLSAPSWIQEPEKGTHAWQATNNQEWVAPIAGLSTNTNNLPGIALLPPVSPHGFTFRVANPGLVNGSYTLAIATNGTLWVWGTVALSHGHGIPMTYSSGLTNYWKLYSNPIQVCRETNWVGFSAGRPQNARGDTWVLFTAPPNPAQSIASLADLYHSRIPVQAGAGLDWIAVESSGSLIQAVRSDGTLWGWGAGQNSGYMRLRYPQLTQLCAETNWVGIERLFGQPLVRNNAGELWSIAGNTTGVPSPGERVNSIGTLLAHTASSHQLPQPGNPFRKGNYLFKIGAGGTLWFNAIEFTSGRPPAVILEAQQAGPRTDWIAAANAPGVFFGLTADGTLWTWGRNPGEPQRVEARDRLELAKWRAEAALGLLPPNSGVPNLAGLRDEPRALMKLVPEKQK